MFFHSRIETTSSIRSFKPGSSSTAKSSCVSFFCCRFFSNFAAFFRCLSCSWRNPLVWHGSGARMRLETNRATWHQENMHCVNGIQTWCLCTSWKIWLQVWEHRKVLTTHVSRKYSSSATRRASIPLLQFCLRICLWDWLILWSFPSRFPNAKRSLTGSSMGVG